MAAASGRIAKAPGSDEGAAGGAARTTRQGAMGAQGTDNAASAMTHEARSRLRGASHVGMGVADANSGFEIAAASLAHNLLRGASCWSSLRAVRCNHFW